ncbi:DUF3131 domain-containing protein [Rubellimicrobium arenae]|uniref:DUF3131 domain-containing protein n=1 Tax=Rubellimicrobium arenae TaxID=2817372 RepID=UPI001B30788A|nr:DUF3131 domain-containing protein [Rubellimicrobium arenae]
MAFGEQGTRVRRQGLFGGCVALLLVPLAAAAQESERPPPTSSAALDTPLTEEELAWAQAAWAYFTSTGDAPPAEGAPPRPPLVPARAGAPIASAWSMGDQLAATLLAHRLGLIDDREFDQRFTRLLTYISTMPLAFGELPNRFYSTDTGAMLGEDFAEGQAGWSAVDTGRLLIWLRIAAEQHPEFASFIRNAVGRFSVCGAISDQSRLQRSRPGENGTEYAAETSRGYDSYAVQGYRAWGLDAPIPQTGPANAEIDIDGVRFPLDVDVTSQAPIMTTPPAYMGLEFGFLTLGPLSGEEVAGGLSSGDLMTAVYNLQALRTTEAGLPTARADFRRSEEPFTLYGTILANGYPWSTVDPGGTLYPRLDLISTRAVFALDAFFDGAVIDTLTALTAELHDPAAGWYEGRYEATGAYEATRTSATNAFVLEAIAYRHLEALFPRTAWPEELGPAASVGGSCRLPLAVPAPT